MGKQALSPDEHDADACGSASEQTRHQHDASAFASELYALDRAWYDMENPTDLRLAIARHEDHATALRMVFRTL